jgi:hypothetical protein
MAHYSPELIIKTISLFESRTSRATSQEEARQSLENISGFFQVLQEWAEAEGCEGGHARNCKKENQSHAGCNNQKSEVANHISGSDKDFRKKA